MRESVVVTEGSTEIVIIRARFDNPFYPVTGLSLADNFAAERLGARTWRARRTKAGELMFIETLTLAVDGPRIREEGVTILPDGSRVHATLI